MQFNMIKKYVIESVRIDLGLFVIPVQIDSAGDPC